MDNQRQFFSEDELLEQLSDDEIEAAMDVGHISAWRVDASGRQWYRKTYSPIHGVPKADEELLG